MKRQDPITSLPTKSEANSSDFRHPGQELAANRAQEDDLTGIQAAIAKHSQGNNEAWAL